MKIANKEQNGGQAADALFAAEKGGELPNVQDVLAQLATGTRVTIFHGDNDALVPLAAVEDAFPAHVKPRGRVIPGGTHSLIFDIEVMTHIIQESGRCPLAIVCSVFPIVHIMPIAFLQRLKIYSSMIDTYTV